MIPQNILIDFKTAPVKDIAGNVIGTLPTGKPLTFLEKIVAGTLKNHPQHEWAAIISQAIDSTYVGDNNYNSIRKNYITFLKHIQVIDSEGSLTDSGFNLYHIGLSNGPTSKIFADYFTREVLTTGHHLDLLLDIDALSKKHPDKDIDEILSIMETDYVIYFKNLLNLFIGKRILQPLVPNSILQRFFNFQILRQGFFNRSSYIRKLCFASVMKQVSELDSGRVASCSRLFGTIDTVLPNRIERSEVTVGATQQR